MLQGLERVQTQVPDSTLQQSPQSANHSEQQWEKDAKSLESRRPNNIAWETSCFQAAREGWLKVSDGNTYDYE